MLFDPILTNTVLPLNNSVLEGYDSIWTWVHLAQLIKAFFKLGKCSKPNTLEEISHLRD